MTSNGPLPSKLVLLSSLHVQDKGTKVRFLGCVARYDVMRGVLELRHPSPTSTSDVVVLVDVNVILETLSAENLEVGAWVNVVGYVGSVERHGGRGAFRPRKYAREDFEAVVFVVKADAVMLWGTKCLRIDEYTEAVQGRSEKNKQLGE